MLVEEIYCKTPYTISPDKTIKEAMETLVKDDSNGLIVVDGEKVVGVLAVQDIAGATLPKEFKDNVNLAHAMFKSGMFSEVCQELSQKKVKDIMRKDYLTVELDTNIFSVMSDFLVNDLYIVPVLKNNKLIGVITRNDIRNAIAQKMDVKTD